MNKKDLQKKAQEIINDIDMNDKDGGLSFIDLNNAYNEIIELAEEYTFSSIKLLNIKGEGDE